MKKKQAVRKKADPERTAALRSLPLHIKEMLSPDEVNAFLHEEVWPDSLFEKLKDFIVEED